MNSNITVFNNGVVILGHPENWGIIPAFLSRANPEPAWKQIDAAYQGGWRPLPDWQVLEVNEEQGFARAKYPGDPELRTLPGFMTFRDEVLWMFPHEVVMLKGKSGTWELCRLD
jgi:hypothetical protein